MEDRKYYTLPDLLDRLGFDYDYDRGKMDCPFCGSKRKLSLDWEENQYRCPKCGKSGGVFHLFAYFHMGYELEKKAPKAEKAKVAKALAEFMDGVATSTQMPARPPKPKRPKVPVASDEKLNAVFSAMAKNPALQLTADHREHLLKRGLTDEVITRNGYLSLPEEMPVTDYYQKLYEQAGGETRRTHEMNWIPKKNILFGLMIAHHIISKGLDVQGVPGFFLFGQYWAYWVNPGILIPTRNIQGQIVIWQVRRDKLRKKDDLRYITSSCKSLPGHVTDNVSRCHFPIGNAPLSSDVPFLLTEGPLKADVACQLYGKPVIFAAIPGIQNTKELYERYIPVLKKARVKRIYNALDMDRLTNPNVREGSRKIVSAFHKRGRIVVEEMYWGSQYAAATLMSLLFLAQVRKVPIPAAKTENVFDRLCMVSEALEQAQVSTLLYRDASGNTVAWEPKTKGIDDYLFNRE